MPAERVFSAHSETFQWRRCCILLSEARQAWEGKAQCPLATAFSQGLPSVPRGSLALSASTFWCLAKGPWPENPAPFPTWAVSWGFLGVAICSD